jgi:hypothetical protein
MEPRPLTTEAVHQASMSQGLCSVWWTAPSLGVLQLLFWVSPEHLTACDGDLKHLTACFSSPTTFFCHCTCDDLNQLEATPTDGPDSYTTLTPCHRSSSAAAFAVMTLAAPQLFSATTSMRPLLLTAAVVCATLLWLLLQQLWPTHCTAVGLMAMIDPKLSLFLLQVETLVGQQDSHWWGRPWSAAVSPSAALAESSSYWRNCFLVLLQLSMPCHCCCLCCCFSSFLHVITSALVVMTRSNIVKEDHLREVIIWA